jgi:hypothetical protein
MIHKTEKLTAHHFIVKKQAEFLRLLKSKLPEAEVILLLDFAENYSFIVQDAAQGYHWDNSQCTLHPFVLYYKQSDVLKCVSICIISNCMRHDTVAVHAFQRRVIEYITTILPTASKLYYFSDGAASQYKNYKNFSNLMNHKKDFDIDAEWHFFPTSHGKSPCDGVGGTVKRAVARASLQATTSGFILTPDDLYKWCQMHISGIQFFWVGQDEVEEHGKKLQKRFDSADKIPGTRENHSFIPHSNGLHVSRISGTETHFVSGTTSGVSVEAITIAPGCYIACLYDGLWWVGSIRSVSDENNDYEVMFMHPHGPSKSFRWPQREDICLVDEDHILCQISAPGTTTGRSYVLSSEDSIRVNNAYLRFKIAS